MRYIELPIPYDGADGRTVIVWQTMQLASPDDVNHARYILACLGLRAARVYDDDAPDDAPDVVLLRDGRAPFVEYVEASGPAETSPATDPWGPDDVLPF